MEHMHLHVPVQSCVAVAPLLIVIHCGFSYVDVIEQAVVAGDTVLIENLEETIDPVLDPLLGRHTIKKGR